MISTHLFFFILIAQLLSFTTNALPAGGGLFGRLSLLNETFHDLAGQVSGAQSTVGPPQCTGSLEWAYPAATFGDCEAALDWMHFEELSGGEDKRRRQFINQGAKRDAKSGGRLQPTPRKYTFGECFPGI